MIYTNIVPIANEDLFALFHDKKVVHISDLHITSIGYREKKLIKMLNRINPDILFLTGDLLTYGKDNGYCVKVLQRIKSPPYGIWVVLGNSDRYDKNGLNEDVNGFIKELQNLGIRVLENKCERLVLNGNGNNLFIVGVEGAQLSRSKLNCLLRDIPDNSPVIFLSHYPDILEERADALVINLEEAEDMGVSGWGWQDNAFFEYDSGIVRFEKDGQHILRVQRREDGVIIEQICLVAVQNEKSLFNVQVKKSSNKLSDIYSTINPNSNEMIIIKAEDIPDSYIFGSWKKVRDPGANYNLVIKDIQDLGIKNEIPLLTPEDYFEASFYAKADIDYHVWVRMKAENDLISNDSIYIQFNDTIDEQGESVYRIGEFGARNKLNDIDLILTGHTHGGQLRFPIFGPLDMVPHHKIKYDMGLFESQGTKMYVNRGIGIVILPMRLLCPPEITLFKFKKVETVSKEENEEVIR